MQARVSVSVNRSSLRALALLATLTACGGKDAQAPVGTDDHGNPHSTRPAAVESTVSGYLVAQIGGSSLGPFFTRRGSGPAAAGLVAWVTPAEGAGRRVLVVPVGAKGAPIGGEIVAANVPLDTTSIVVRPMRGPAPGFVVAWTSLNDRGKSLWALAVNDDGVPRTKPVELTRSTDDITWVDVVPTDRGALCLWAEETRGNDVNLVAAAIDASGKVQGAAARVARGVVGWQALELPDGVGLSTVEPAPADPKAKTPHTVGTLSFQRLDPEGHAVAPAVIVTTKPNVSGDVEVAREPSGRLVFAWTDRTAAESTIVAAALDERNVVEAPRPLLEPRGGAALVGLASSAAGTAVLFESPTRRKGDTRRVHVARLGSGLALARPLSLEVLGRAQPELAATPSGFTVLATAADCEQGTPACLNADSVATLFRTDADGALVQREPLTFLSDPATNGWGMTCDGDTCFSLAASPGLPGTPTRVRAVAVRPRAGARAPLAAAKPDTPAPNGPRIEDVTAIVTGESVVDIASARFGETLIVATLSSSSTVSTRIVDKNGAAQAPATLTTRALSAGGVAIAPAATPDDGGAVAWVARDGGDPEVHLTRIDKHGRRTSDIQLTHAKGDATDVTITWANGGWIVAWVDGRDGNGEVYAARVPADLTKIGREERITKAPGDASDLVAIANGDAVWLAWSDPRESPKDGIADVFVSAVRMKDGKRLFEEQCVLPTAAHSRTPQLASGPEGVYIAWIEEAPLGSETPDASGYGAFSAKLDANGKPETKPQRIPLAAPGAATSVAIQASPSLRAVVARSTSDAIALDAVDLMTTPPTVSTLLALDGPPSLDVALVLDGDAVYFNDAGPRPADRRARRARIAWQPK